LRIQVAKMPRPEKIAPARVCAESGRIQNKCLCFQGKTGFSGPHPETLPRPASKLVTTAQTIG